MSTTLKDGTRVEDARLGRMVQFDERSRNYPIIRKLTTEQQRKPRSYTWNCPLYLDQVDTTACVGASRTMELAARPVPVKNLDFEFAFNKIYLPAQRIDYWDGEEPEFKGSSVLAGVQVAAELGYYTEYHWAFSEEEMFLGIGWTGPAVIGVNWYEDMMTPNSKGYITPTGQSYGGHAILVKGVNLTKGYRLHNSWGRNWGVNGEAFMTRSDMARLLGEDGECCLSTYAGRTIPTV